MGNKEIHAVPCEYYSVHAIPQSCGAVATISKSKFHCTRALKGSYQLVNKQIEARMWLRAHDLNPSKLFILLYSFLD